MILIFRLLVCDAAARQITHGNRHTTAAISSRFVYLHFFVYLFAGSWIISECERFFNSGSTKFLIIHSRRWRKRRRNICCFDKRSRAVRVSRLKFDKLAAKEKSNLIIEANITTERTTTKEGINLSESGAAQKASDPIIKSNSFASTIDKPAAEFHRTISSCVLSCRRFL